MNTIIQLVIARDLKCEGITYGISETQVKRLESYTGTIEDEMLLLYLRRWCPIWPVAEREARYVCPDMMDYDTIVEIMDNCLPSCYLGAHGFLVVSDCANGDAIMVNVKTGIVICASHDLVNSENTAAQQVSIGIPSVADNLMGYFSKNVVGLTNR